VIVGIDNINLLEGLDSFMHHGVQSSHEENTSESEDENSDSISLRSVRR